MGTPNMCGCPWKPDEDMWSLGTGWSYWPLIMSHSLWVLGPELTSSGRAVNTLNCWTISPAPCARFLMLTHWLKCVVWDFLLLAFSIVCLCEWQCTVYQLTQLKKTEWLKAWTLDCRPGKRHSNPGYSQALCLCSMGAISQEQSESSPFLKHPSTRH